MKKLCHLKIDSILALLFALCLFVFFAGGCAAKFFYQINNDEPAWLDSVVVPMFGGMFLGICGLLGVLASIKLWKRTNWLYKIGAILIFMFYGLLQIFIGLYTLWIAMDNLIKLL